MYDKSSHPRKATWTCINKELGWTFHSFTHLELCLSGAQLSRACATSLGRRGVGFICWLSLAIYLSGLLFFFRGDLLSLTFYLIIESIIKKLCWVFFPNRVSQDNIVVSFMCLVYLSVDLFNVICKRTLTCKNINIILHLLSIDNICIFICFLFF